MDDVSLFDYIKMHSYPLMIDALAYGNAKRGDDGKEDLSKGWYDNIDQLSFYRPFFRTVLGHNHTMFVLDVDVELSDSLKILYTDEEQRDLRVRVALETFDDKKWRKFLMYISGQGMYLVQRYDKQINKSAFEPIIFGNEFSLLNKCSQSGRHTPSVTCDGWHSRTQEYIKVRMIEGEIVLIKIDKRMFNHEGKRLFRGVYSPYFKVVGNVYYCIPVIWRGDNIDIKETIERSKQDNMLIPHHIEVPKFSFDEYIEDVEYNTSDVARSTIRKYTPTRNNYINYYIDIPPPNSQLSKSQEALLERMERLVNGDVTVTPPCVRNSYKQVFNRFWSRVMLVRYLAGKGYTPDEVALFIRFKVNDEEDNNIANMSNLSKYVRIAYGDPANPIPITSCLKLQDIHHEHYSCTPEDREICNRTYPMQDYQIKMNVVNNSVTEVGGIDQWIKKNDKNIPENIDDIKKVVDFSKINNMASEIFSTSENYEIIKTTRAGVTTSLINQVAITHKKMICVSPTNRIGEETFSQAMRIAHQLYGIDITGAIMSANTKSCLKLRFQIKDLEHRKREEPEWGENGVKYKDLAFHFKPSCVSTVRERRTECEFYRERFPMPYTNDGGIPLPIITSEIREYEPDGLRSGLCAYTSVVNDLMSFDILFITYDKLNSILMDERSDDAELVYNTMISEYDVLFLDEISQLAQHSPLSFTIFREDAETGMRDEMFFDRVYEDYDILMSYKVNETVVRLGDFIDIFINYIRPLIEERFIENDEYDEKFTIRQENPIPDDMIDEYNESFVSFYSLLENFTKETNIHLSNLEKVVLLLKSDFWWINNIPTNEYTINVSLISSPKIVNIRRFVRDFSNNMGKQVLVTDATMPLIKMSDLFDVPFVRYVVGDPRGTQDHQLIISDTKTINTKALLYEDGVMLNKLVKFINEVCMYHDPSTIMLVLPNSGKIYRNIKDKIKDKKMPKMLVTYYRSDMTVGVSSDKRVMIAVCPPYPPTNSYLWLAQYYHEWGLFNDVDVNVLSSNLERMNAYQTFYQTIGRVKSPDCTNRSVVYAWGINSSTLSELLGMDNDVPLPHITTVNHRGADNKYLPIVGMFWSKYGVIISPNIVRVMEFLKKKKNQKFTYRSLVNNIFRKMNKKIRDKIVGELENIPITVLEKYGIFVTEEGNKDKIYAV